MGEAARVAGQKSCGPLRRSDRQRFEGETRRQVEPDLQATDERRELALWNELPRATKDENASQEGLHRGDFGK